MIFFNPTRDLVKSIAEYAGNRIIIDVGCGRDGYLLTKLKEFTNRLVGIDPYFNPNLVSSFLMNYGIHIFTDKVQEYPYLITEGKDKILLLFCRPCHSTFVVDTLDIKHNDTEALYITLPENLEKYNDLGKYKHKAVEIKLNGTSKDNEVILSIK